MTIYGTFQGRKVKQISAQDGRVTLVDIETGAEYTTKANRFVSAKVIDSNEYVIMTEKNEFFDGVDYYSNVIEMAKRYPTYKKAVNKLNQLLKTKNNLFYVQLNELINWNDGKGWSIK